jgi:hypothetical protein
MGASRGIDGFRSASGSEIACTSQSSTLPPVADRHPSAAPGHPPRFGQGGDEVGGELEGVEPRDHIEAVIGPGEPLDGTDSKIRGGQPLPGDLDESLGRVDAAHPGAACGGECAELAASTAQVEQRGSRLDPGCQRHGLASGSAERGPVSGPAMCGGTPRRTLRVAVVRSEAVIVAWAPQAQWCVR